MHQLFEILADNTFTTKYKEVPDEVDNRDEILAEIQAVLDDDGFLPDSLLLFEINGQTDANELATYIEKSFQQFKYEFFAAKLFDNDLLKNELLKQLAEIKEEIEHIIHESKQLTDETLPQMLVVKSMICDEVIEFIHSHQDNSDQKPSKKEPQEKRSFKWLKEDELLTKFFEKLIADELICKTTDINDFKTIFSHKPVSIIKKPVQWEKGAKLFAYFFSNLMNQRFIPQKPSWIILKYCFTYYKSDIGKYVPIEEGVKAHVTAIQNEGAPKGADLIDVLFQ